VPPDLMEELLQAADQYMLGSLKRLCEIAIADTLTVRRLRCPFSSQLRC